jgi:hypothetical protein
MININEKIIEIWKNHNIIEFALDDLAPKVQERT